MTMIRRLFSVLVLLALVAGLSIAQTPAPPSGYVNASEILPLPNFISTAGSLYIEPANAPVGPWLAYGNDGSLIELLYMIPVAQMQAAQNWDDLGADIINDLGMTLDHVDISVNGGHPGMAELHYHIRLVFVDHEAQLAALGQ
jgi:hypothetical protein